jgi:hypothetical protein
MQNRDQMNSAMRQAALATWAAKDLPARLLAEQVANLLNCSTDDIAILVGAGKLRPLGRPKPNAVKFFNAIELIALLADPDWLNEATKTIGQFWRQKNARRNGLTLERQPGCTSADAVNPVNELQQKPSTISSTAEVTVLPDELHLWHRRDIPKA